MIQTTGKTPKALVSNGSNQFHLTPLSVELNKKGVLVGMLTSGWPTKFTGLLAKPFMKKPAVRRFFNRRDDLPMEKLFVTNFAEFIFQIGIKLRKISEHTEQRFDRLAFKWYSAYASFALRKIRPNIYHYRACYGLGSVDVAKEIGAIAICDHSIAHPSVLQYMVENRGEWPEYPCNDLKSPLQQLMQRDIAQGNYILVNSDFVKKTCVFSGVPAERVKVIYWGIDSRFMTGIPDFDENQVHSRAGASFLFAGGIQTRKGAVTLAEAFSELGLLAPQLKMVGGLETGLEQNSKVKALISSDKVTRYGFVLRDELARHMSSAPVFIFPSYCEGSARVIFEAMACGCYIITTENSGSVVKDGEHGVIVPAGNATALADAILWATNNAPAVAAIGWRNSLLVRKDYRQDQYAEKVIEFYNQILGIKL